MPASLPDPVLALSMTSIQKLNSADVDQLANLWNVFTKCKESLESGRRLENLSWRLWYREAHILPPDTSLSDMSDFTPLGTPLTSRRSSINGTASLQQQSRGLTPVLAMPSAARMSYNGQPAAAQAMTSPSTQARISDDLSDPEGGEDWSDEDSSDDVSPGPSQRPAQTKMAPTNNTTRSAERATLERSRDQSRPTSKTASPVSTSAASSSRRDRPDFLTSPPVSLTAMAAQAATSSSSSLRPSPGDRRRAVSSSSAFGSRARVKQANMHHRHRPLSFQQAVESLLRPEAEVGFSRGQKQDGSRATTQETDVHTADDVLQRDATAGNGDLLTVQESLAAHSQQRNSAPPRLEEEVKQRILEAETREKEGINEDTATNAQPKKSKPVKAARFFVEPESPSQGSRSVAADTAVGSEEYAQPSGSGKREEPSRRDSVQSATQSTTDSAYAAQNTARTSKGRGRGRAQLGMGTGRSRSGLALNRRSMSGYRGSHRNSQTHVSRISDEHEASADEYVDVEADEHEPHAAAPSIQEERAESSEQRAAAKQKAPVKFHMGSLGSEDGSEEGVSHSRRRSIGSVHSDAKSEQRAAPAGPPAIKETEAEDEDKSDDWASDTSDEWETEQVNNSRLAKDEKESLFKKIPIRSKSAADLQLLAPSNQKEIEETAAALGASPTPAVRGLLSSIFHPDDAGTMRRSHASAADLRHTAPPHEAKNVRKTSHDEPTTSGQTTKKPETQSRPLPMTQVGSFAGSNLKLSKSAVALPVLSTTGSRSTAQGSKRSKAAASKDAAVFEDSDEEGGDDEQALSGGSASAVMRLNELATSRKQTQSNAKKQNQPSNSTKSRRGDSNSSLEVQVEPELDEDEIRRHRRTTTATPAEPVRRTQSAVDVPDTGMPQSPRTTRRNMLRDELSESLRQNLLWERKSRNRMLGIGASGPQSVQTAAGQTQTLAGAHEQEERIATTQAPAVTRQGRPPSVLSGARLRPLTARSGSGNTSGASDVAPSQQQPQDRNTRTSRIHENNRHHYTGDFHHAGW